MRMVVKAALVLAIGMVMTGCIDMQVKRFSMKKYMPVNPEDVAVYTNESEIPGAYEKVATIHLQDERVNDSRERILKHIKDEAGSLGANAVVVGSLNAPEVPAEFREDAFQSDSFKQTGTDLPQPVKNMQPEKQDAWMDILAVYVKRK